MFSMMSIALLFCIMALFDSVTGLVNLYPNGVPAIGLANGMVGNGLVNGMSGINGMYQDPNMLLAGANGVKGFVQPLSASPAGIVGTTATGVLGTTSPATSAVVDTHGRIVGTTPTALVNAGLVAANNAAVALQQQQAMMGAGTEVRSMVQPLQQVVSNPIMASGMRTGSSRFHPAVFYHQGGMVYHNNGAGGVVGVMTPPYNYTAMVEHRPHRHHHHHHYHPRGMFATPQGMVGF